MEFDRNMPPGRLRPRDEALYVSQSRTVLSTATDGFIHGEAGQGLFVFQTRLLSRYVYTINGQSVQPVGISNIEDQNQLAYYVIESPNADRDLFRGALGPGGRAATEAVELQLSRFVTDGLQEEVELRNHTLRPVRLTLELAIDSDFADIAEVHSSRRQHGRLERAWRVEDGAGELTWTYTAEHDYEHQGNVGKASLQRGATVRFATSGSPPGFDDAASRVRFDIELAPHGSWHCRVLVSALMDGRALQPEIAEQGFASSTPRRQARERFLRDSTQIDIETPPLALITERALDRARRDLVGLRLYDLDREDGGWTPAAGLPVYIALFGRDALTASWQAALLSDELMRGALAELAETQATGRNDWYDAQPGRFVHQMETGPLAALRYNPHERYYGSLTGPGFYPVVLSNLWHWTGNDDVIRRFLDPALQGLAWLERDAKRDDGFYAYQTRSEQGVKNQAWKDSYDAIVYPDGSQVQAPIAPTEFQAFVFASKVRISEMLWWLGQRDDSRRLFDEAIALRDRFDESFWMEDEGCFGMGLDPAGELIRSIGSESAHAVAAGIVKPEKVERTVQRLFQPDMFSGWGLRTLSALHPAFNPFSYHRGSVWPAEQAAFCMGLMRYGFHERLHLVAKAQLEAAALFEYCRLPELFSGHQRDDRHPLPALYPHADSPQAWSASAVPCMIQAMLGLFPYAPLHALFIDPHLPEWLPVLRLRDLRVGDARVDIRFRRHDNGETGYQVLDMRGSLHVVRQPSPWSVTAGFGERLIDAVASFLPGH